VSEPASALEPADLAKPETPRERIAYLMYAGVERAAMALPESWGRRLFHMGGTAAYYVAPRARGVIERNLSRVLGKGASPEVLRAASKEAFRSYARYWFDAFRVRVMSDEEFIGRIRIDGEENLAAAVEAGRGAIVALPHMGNWDVAGKWVHVRGWKITAVAELLRPERLFQLFVDHRRALGLRILPLYDDRRAGEELLRLLSENEVIALVADRDLKGKGVEVEMFDERRLIPAGPALLSLASGAPLLPCAVYDSDDGWAIQIEQPLSVERSGTLREDVAALSRALSERFERAISAAPTQWHMFQPAWPADQDGTLTDEGVTAAAGGAPG
jgi:phosphatidylinositol dimannoside acyltransferase